MKQAMQMIRELQEARGLVPEWELAERARAIFERSDMKPLELADFLRSKGLRGARLAHAMGTFPKAVAVMYRDHYGYEPIKTVVPAAGSLRMVNAYVEADRPVVEAAYRSWRGRDFDAVMAGLNRLAAEQEADNAVELSHGLVAHRIASVLANATESRVAS
jgi:hypothetical protein